LSHEGIKKGWSDADTAMLIALVAEHAEHKNKWKLVAARMPEARTPGQVKEKFHRLQKSLDFLALQTRVLANPAIHLPEPHHDHELLLVTPRSCGGTRLARLASDESFAAAGRPAVAASRRSKRAREEAPRFDDGAYHYPEESIPVRSGKDAHAPSLPEFSMATAAAGDGGGVRLMRSKKSASGFRGVSRAGSRWEAYIGNGTSGKRYIGRFDTAEEAAEAYAIAFAQLSGRLGESVLELEEEEEEESQLARRPRSKRPRRQGPAYWAESPGSEDDQTSSGTRGAQNETVKPEPKALFAARVVVLPLRPAPASSRRGSLPSLSMPTAGKAAGKRGGSRPLTPSVPMVLPAGVTLQRSPHAASGFQGVSRAGSKWEAYLSGGPGKVGKKYIGRFGTPEEAATAYAIAVWVKHGAGEPTLQVQ